MFPVQAQDDLLLTKAISEGEAILVLGAGASATSTNKGGGPVKQGTALAKLIAEAAGFKYTSESLPVVLGAARPVIGDARLLRIYESEFRDINPGWDVRSISNFSWRRIYTWNIDDALNNALTNKSQRVRFYNGKSTNVVENDDISAVQIIKLHGDILNPDDGFIMSEADYATTIAHGGHHWYRKIAQDYISYTPIFIGSRLAEPILSAEIERAKRTPSDASGYGFLITPDELTDLEKSSLRARSIIHIKATLGDFITWLSSKFPKGLYPKDILASTNLFSHDDLLNKLTQSDLSVARALYPRDAGKLKAAAASSLPSVINKEARRFLRGFPPSWEIAASDIPVWLSPTDDLYNKLNDAIVARSRMFVVTGQAGSGKSTAVLQCLVKYGTAHPDVPIYELTGDIKSVRSAFQLISRLHEGRVIVYISDIFVFGDNLSDDLMGLERGEIILVCTARKGEWNEHFQRRFGRLSYQYEYSRFGSNDYEPLIERLIQYVPSPSFKSLSPTERRKKLSQSKEQLLIALREATNSQNFSDIITDEFERLPDADTRTLLIIVGLGTLARVGIEPGSAKEAYSKLAKTRSFEEAELALDGIVSRLPNGRLFARHELYVRHIINDVADLTTLIDCLIAIAANYTKYGIPVVRQISKIEGVLFRFCWNHSFILEQCKTRGRLHDGERLYSNFEIDFQLDGHFWLQYGLYLSACGRHDEALTMLRRSIEAYPNNSFAVHAHAELQFQTASRRGTFDTLARHLVEEAVNALERLDARKDDEVDQYPLVTLANHHVGILVLYNEHKSAKIFARTYFDRLQQMEKRINSQRVTEAKDRLLRYVTLDEWRVIR